MNDKLTLVRNISEFGEGYKFDSPSKTLTDAHFKLFSDLTGDVGKSHTDAEYAKRTKLGKPSVHGLLLNALTALGASNFHDRPDGFILVEQGCKYCKSVVSGDTVFPQFVIEKVWQEGHKTYCRLATTLVNQRGEVILQGFHLYRIIPPKPLIDGDV